MMWTLEQAQELISALQPDAWVMRWNLCVGGGVLNNGCSNNDLDVVAIPTGFQAKNSDVLVLFTNSGWVKVEEFPLTCAYVYKLEMDRKVLELIIMKCGQIL